MDNVEKLKEMISLLAENHIAGYDAINAYLASITTSLAVIADKLTEERDEDIDLINRKQAEECCLNGWNKDYKEILEDIRKLPSAK